MAAVVGIDLSFLSTGICFRRRGGKCEYHNIIREDSISKKQWQYLNSLKLPHIKFYSYKKSSLNSDLKSICDIIKSILKGKKIDLVVIEDIAFQASGRVADLSMLNGYTRSICDQLNLTHTSTPPTHWKKVCTGNGKINKEETIKIHMTLDDSAPFDTINPKGDLSDAYFLAMYGVKELK